MMDRIRGEGNKPIPFGDLATTVVHSSALPALDYIGLLVDIFGPEPIIAAVRNHPTQPIDALTLVERWADGQSPRVRVKTIQDGAATAALERLAEERCSLSYDLADCYDDMGCGNRWVVSINGNAGGAGEDLFGAVRRAVAAKRQGEPEEDDESTRMPGVPYAH